SAQSGGASGNAGVARVDELHDLRVLQLAAVLPRSPGEESGLGGWRDQLAAGVVDDRGERGCRPSVARDPHAHRRPHGVGGRPGGGHSAVRCAHQLLCRGGAVPGLRGGPRRRDAGKAGLPERPHPFGAARYDHLARLDVRQHRWGERPNRLGLPGSDAVDRDGVDLGRVHAAPRPAAVLAGAARRQEARRLRCRHALTQTGARLRVFAAAACFSTGGALFKLATLTGWQVAGLRGGLAAVSALTFALTMMGYRWLAVGSGGSSGAVAAAAVSGNVLAFLFCLPFALPLGTVSLTDWAIVAWLGVVQLGAGYAVLARAVPYLPALEVSLLLLLEPVLNLIGTCLFHYEQPGRWTVV